VHAEGLDQHGGRHALAAVAHVHDGAPVRLRQLEVQRAAARHRLEGVDDQVDQRLLEVVPRAEHRHALGRHLQAGRDAQPRRLGPRQHDHLGQQPAQAEDARLIARRARLREQVLQHARQARDLAADEVEPLLRVAAGLLGLAGGPREVPAQQVHVERQRVQRGAQVVGRLPEDAVEAAHLHREAQVGLQRVERTALLEQRQVTRARDVAGGQDTHVQRALAPLARQRHVEAGLALVLQARVIHVACDALVHEAPAALEVAGAAQQHLRDLVVHERAARLIRQHDAAVDGAREFPWIPPSIHGSSSWIGLQRPRGAPHEPTRCRAGPHYSLAARPARAPNPRLRRAGRQRA
jgi:hypothetical protein